jgi:hypothetical protein
MRPMVTEPLDCRVSAHHRGLRMSVPCAACENHSEAWLGVFVSRIVFRPNVFKAKRPNRAHLGNVFTGFCPVEMGRVARQKQDATGRIRLQLIRVELIAQAYVENAGYNCVDSILPVPVWHQLHAAGYSDAHRVQAGLRGLTKNDRQAGRRWKRGEGFPVDVFGQDRSETVLAGLVRLNGTLLCFHDNCFSFV